MFLCLCTYIVYQCDKSPLEAGISCIRWSEILLQPTLWQPNTRDPTPLLDDEFTTAKALHAVGCYTADSCNWLYLVIKQLDVSFAAWAQKLQPSLTQRKISVTHGGDFAEVPAILAMNEPRLRQNYDKEKTYIAAMYITELTTVVHTSTVLHTVSLEYGRNFFVCSQNATFISECWQIHR